MASKRVPDCPWPLPKDFVPGKIGVVTVTYNSGPVMPEFIRSVDVQRHSKIAVYAIDNASQDDTLEQLHAWKRDDLRIIANAENRGVAAGNNQGIRAAIEDGCEFILLLNNDVSFHEDLFERLVAGIHRFECEMTTPKTYFYSPDDVLWCAGGCLQKCFLNRTRHYGEGLRDDGRFDIARQVSYAPTCCVLIHREVFRRIGIMDERYFVYGDDTDFMVRAQRAGVALYYLPEARLWHKVSSLSGASSDFTLFYSTRGRSLLIRKNSGFVLALTWSLFYSMFCVMRCCAGKDSWYKVLVRIKGTRSGVVAAGVR